MTTLFKNNAWSQLAVAAGSGAVSLSLTAGTGARFPAPGANTFFVTVEDLNTGQMEIMLCTARVADVLTVTRAQEGTIAQNFAVGAFVAMRLTAGMLLALQTYAYDQAAADARFVNVAGDTMTGPLIGTAVTLSGVMSALQFIAPNNVAPMSLAATDLAAIFGQIAGANLALSRGAVQARSNGVAATLSLNPFGGNVAIATVGGSAVLDLATGIASQIKFGNNNNSVDVDTLDGYKDYIQSTPTLVGFGTPSSIGYFSKRVGDQLSVECKFTAGTSTAVEARVPLLLNGVALTSDATKISSITAVGFGCLAANSAAGLQVLVESGVTYLTFGLQGAASFGLTKQNGSALVSGVAMSFSALVPISGW